MTIKYNVESKKGKLVISEKTANYKIDLRERLVDFAVNTIKFLGTIPYRKEDIRRYLIQESKEISLIMGSIASKLNNNRIVSL
jgi:hypothetical protein